MNNSKKKKSKKTPMVGLIGGSYFSARKMPLGIELKKYDPVARKHVVAKSVKSKRTVAK